MLRWMMQNQERLRPHAQWLLLLTVTPLIVATAYSDQQVLPMVAGIALAPLLLPRVPARSLRAAAIAFGVFLALAIALAFSPIGDPVP